VRFALGGDDELNLWAPNERVVEAVQALGGRVTKADVLERGVSAAGLERELLRLAKASGAGLRVNERGELLYEFPNDLPGALSSRNTAAKLQQAWTTVSPWLSYGGRVLFGVSLLATVAVLYSAVVVLLSTSTSDREDRGGNRSTFVSQNSFAMWFGLFYEEPPPKMSFFEAVFSFVFGDGDPNAQLLSEARWQLIGETIAQNGGSVVAEQVSPYLDQPEGGASSQSDPNKAMLPVLLRFKGRPEVTPEGDILYVFPELQESRAAGELIVGELPTKEMKKRLGAMGRATSAVERPDIVAEYRRALVELRQRSASASPTSLVERELKFSEADDGQIAASAGLGAFAFLATLFFGSQILTGKVAILARLYPVIGLVAQGFPWLLGYTGAFLGIPAWRWLRLGGANEEIQKRNDWRAQQAAKLQQPEQGLRRRLDSASERSRQRKSFGDAVYDTSQSTSAREEQKELDDLKKFDDLLR